MERLSNYKVILKYLFIPGLILTVAGLVPIIITQTTSILYLSLTIIGGIFLFIWLIYLLVTGRKFWNKRSTQTGTNAFVSIVSILVILTLINFIAVRYSPRIDLTENQLYTLSPETQKIVENLDKTIKVYIFDKEINPQDEDLLENYQRYSSNFKYELVDPDIEVGLTQQFGVQLPGDVYLEYEEKRQLVQSLLVVNQFAQREPLSEIKLTNAIEKIKKDYIPKIYVLQGHGEYSLVPSPEGSLSEAIISLESKGYEVKPLNIVQNGGIPDDADVIIIASPKRELFDQEVQKLKEYSQQGGNLFLLLDPDTDPGLEPILKDWGIKLDNRLIIDGSGSGSVINYGPLEPIITNYGNHPITQEFANGMSVYPFSRPIDTIEVENVQATSLLVTSEQMWAESNLESEEVIFNPEEDIPGPFDLGVALTRTIIPETANNETRESNKIDPDKPNNKQTDDIIKDQETPESSQTEDDNNAEQKTGEEDDNSKNEENKVIEDQANDETNNQPSLNDNDTEEIAEKNSDSQEEKIESRLVIIGNSTFATNNLFSQQLNGDVFLNSVQWLSNQDEQSLSIRPREAKDRRLNLSPFQANIITILSLAVFPLLGLIAAGITWWRRR